MSKDLLILAFSWIVSIIILLNVSKGRVRLTQITFIFSQSLAWLFEYILVFIDLVRFPYREFKIATKMSFSLYYLVFPTVVALFIHLYPKQSSKGKVLLYYLLFSMVIPTYTFLADKYSNLIQIISWKWNWGIHVAIDILIFYIVKTFVFWFQKGLDSN